MTSSDINSDKNLILNAFNTQIFEFIDEVQYVFVEDMSINKIKTALFIIKKVNPSLIIKIWYTYIYSPYKTEITNDNINFFIEKDYKDDVVYLKSSDDIVKNIDKLRDPIRNMGKENQEKSFKYVKNLCILSKLYSEE
jgi:hypothetical protein